MSSPASSASSSHTNDEQGSHVAAAEVEAYDDKTARALMKEEGCDPDNLNKKRNGWGLIPILYFSFVGNFKMVRYLIAHDADCRITDTDGWFPLYSAAYGGNLDICKWLCHQCGAHEDIRRVTGCGWSPLRAALCNGHTDVFHWLILNEALLSPRADVDGGGIDDAIMRRDLRQDEHDEACRRLNVLSWARDAVKIYNNIQLLLKGSLIVPSSSSSSSSPLAKFNGASEIFDIVAEYAGCPTAQELRIFRQLIDLLSAFIDDVPFVEYWSDTDDGDEEQDDDDEDEVEEDNDDTDDHDDASDGNIV